MAEKAAVGAILAYGIRSALIDQRTAMAELETALNAKFGEEFPGRGAFAYSYAASSSLGILDQTAAKIIKGLARGGHVVPYDFWGIGLRFFEWINQSDFRQLLTLS